MLHQTLTESTLAKHFAHKSCLSTYTSNNHIQKHLKKKQRKTVVKRLQNVQKYLGNHFNGIDSV